MSDREAGGAAQRSTARVTPYELAFGEAGLADRLFPRLETSVQRLAVVPTRRDQLVMVPEVTELVREMVPPDAPPDAMEQHRATLFQAFNFWRYGKRLYFYDPAVARFLVEAAPPIPDWEFSTKHACCYLQLPANLFWASIAPDAPPEPVDGFFVTVCEGNRDSPAEPHIFDALMVLGIRRNRAGFSVIPFHTEVGGGIAAEWSDSPARSAGRDFESVLPGGDMAGMYSILTAGEALKLVYRLVWYLDAFPSDAIWEEPAEPRSADRQSGARPTRLPFHRVVLTDSSERAR